MNEQFAFQSLNAEESILDLSGPAWSGVDVPDVSEVVSRLGEIGKPDDDWDLSDIVSEDNFDEISIKCWLHQFQDVFR